jgi:hypothetical protein
MATQPPDAIDDPVASTECRFQAGNMRTPLFAQEIALQLQSLLA